MSQIPDHTIREPVSPAHPLTRSPVHPLAWLFFLAFLSLYVRTAAPSVLSGDSAEFQLSAPLLGVPHPTTYPLYVLLGKLATLALPFGDLAWRVTIVSAVCAALAVALFFLLARQITASVPAALVGALALGLAPGLWNAATMAEVYALLAALLTALLYLIATDDRRSTDDTRHTISHHPPPAHSLTRSLAHPLTRSPAHPLTRSPATHQWWRLRLAAFVAGLGFTHHGLFVIIGLPLLLWYVLWLLIRRHTLKQVALLGLCFSAGLLPWLYPLAQYARYGPFTGEDYGLPRHYYWGAPASWGQALDLLTGGPMRRGIFRPPSIEAVTAVLRLVGRRLLFEFGPIGVPLGMVGSIVLLRRVRRAWIGAAWVFFATLAYLLLLGPAVQDAPVFTLPMLLPWSLWIAAGSAGLIEGARLWWGTQAAGGRWQVAGGRSQVAGRRSQVAGRRSQVAGRRLPTHPLTRSPAHPFTRSPAHPSLVTRHSSLVLVLLIAATLAWGYTRVHVSSKRQLWLFRRFGEATLNLLPPGAAVIAHWEQGMTLQYLIRVEGRRPDVWVDVVEPSDSDWGDRARRYGGRAVFFVGAPADVADLPVKLVREHEYADVFELRR